MARGTRPLWSAATGSLGVCIALASVAILLSVANGTTSLTGVSGAGQDSASPSPSPSQPESQPKAPLQVLLITGQNNHDWEFTAPVFERMLEGTGRFEVETTKDPEQTLAEADLQKFDLFFLDYNGKRWGPRAERRFDAAVKSGIGVVVVHAANNAFPGWIDFETLVGHCWRKGTGHGRFHEFDVTMLDRTHPITGGQMPDLKGHPDELYHRLQHMHGAKHKVLAAAYSDPKTGGTGRYEPMAMVLRHGKGRVFHTPLGHVWRNQPQTRRSVESPGLQLLIARGAEWAGSGTVTLKPGDFGVLIPANGQGTDHSPRATFEAAFGERFRARYVRSTAGFWWVYDVESARLLASISSRAKLEGFRYEVDTTGGTFAHFDRSPVDWAYKSQTEGIRYSGATAEAPLRSSVQVRFLTVSIEHVSGAAKLVEIHPAVARPDSQRQPTRRFEVSGVEPGEYFEVQAAPFPPGRQSLVQLSDSDSPSFEWNEGRLRLQNGVFEWRLTKNRVRYRD